MKIKRVIDGKKHTIKLKRKEENKALAKAMFRLFQLQLPPILNESLLKKCGPDMKLWPSMTGVSLETLLNAQYGREFILPIASDNIDADTSINEALRKACDHHIDVLFARMELVKHYAEYQDALVPIPDGHDARFEYLLKMGECLLAIRATLDEKNPENLLILSALDSRYSDGRAMALATDLLTTAAVFDLYALQAKDCATIAVLNQFPAAVSPTDPHAARVRKEVFAATLFIASVATEAGLSLNLTCKHLFDVPLDEALNANAGTYIARLSDEDYAETDDSIIRLKEIMNTHLFKKVPEDSLLWPIARRVANTSEHQRLINSIAEDNPEMAGLLQLIFGTNDTHDDEDEQDERRDTCDCKEPDGEDLPEAEAEDDENPEAMFRNDICWEEADGNCEEPCGETEGETMDPAFQQVTLEELLEHGMAEPGEPED